MKPTKNSFTYIENEISKWSCQLMPGTTLRPIKGKEPNWFHRKMQQLVLGFIWTKDKP
jgi:hypothetical protein